MKLVELLARELDVWPDGVVQLTQSRVDDEVYNVGVGGDRQISLSPEMFLSEFHSNKGENYPLVTRADWQAERARIAKPAEAKWIRHRGGKCPVERGVLVDVRHRSGDRFERIPAMGTYASIWTHIDHPGDIMAFRICEPAKIPEPEPLSVDELQAVIGKPDGPLQWRDRIHAIDFDVAAQNEAHRLAIEALEEERGQLVQRLADEGFVLARVDGEVAQSEPAEWKVGDLLEITSEEEGHEFEIGQIVRIEEIDHDDDKLPYKCRPVKGGNFWYVNSKEAKFHSRPTA